MNFTSFSHFKQKLEKEKGTWAGFGQLGPRWLAKRPRHMWPSQLGWRPTDAHTAAPEGWLRPMQPRPRGALHLCRKDPHNFTKSIHSPEYTIHVSHIFYT